MIEDLIARGCEFVSKFLPRKDIRGGDGSLYLRRFRVFDTGKAGVRLFLHQFHRGDDDRELHCHPWSWARSLILSGYYVEQRAELDLYTHQSGEVGLTAHRRYYRAGSVNAIEPLTFHRVLLPEGPVWSLILSGPIVQGWGFLDLATRRYTPWREFLAAKFGHPVEDVDHVPFDPPEIDPAGWAKSWLARAAVLAAHR